MTAASGTALEAEVVIDARRVLGEVAPELAPPVLRWPGGEPR